MRHRSPLRCTVLGEQCSLQYVCAADKMHLMKSMAMYVDEYFQQSSYRSEIGLWPFVVAIFPFFAHIVHHEVFCSNFFRLFACYV